MTIEDKETMTTISNQICKLKTERIGFKTLILEHESLLDAMTTNYIVDILNEKTADGKVLFTNETARNAELNKRLAADDRYSAKKDELLKEQNKLQELTIQIERGERLFRIHELFHSSKG